MKYIVIEIQKVANGSVATLVSTYDTRNEAESSYHTILAAAAVSTIPVHACLMVTENGNYVKNEAFHHGSAPVEEE